MSDGISVSPGDVIKTNQGRMQIVTMEDGTAVYLALDESYDETERERLYSESVETFESRLAQASWFEHRERGAKSIPREIREEYLDL